MRDSGPLDGLRTRLAAELEPRRIFRVPVWGDPHAMVDVLRKVRGSFGGSDDDGPPPRDQLVEAVRDFTHAGTVAHFKQLTHVCYGVTLRVERESWRVIDRQPLFDRLLSLVADHEAQPRQFRRCYQGLLSGYFAFDPHVDTPGHGAANWKTLRGFLNAKLQPVMRASQQRGRNPPWLQALWEHRNLLADEPCRRYVDGLQSGDTAELRQLCAGLGIENTSWIWEEALMAYVQSVVQKQDDPFMAGLSGVLDLVNGRADLRLPPTVETRATALAVVRYSSCAERPEHAELRDTSLQKIGNPWLRRSAWDALVKHEPARQMIESWLKRRLIKDFFELLAADGSADLRRLNYWLKWEPRIDDMWFVLGANAQANRSAAFIELRKRMAGRKRTLTVTTADNNAFVMRIGPLLVVEFGVTGNACFVFDAKAGVIDLESASVPVHQLKDSRRIERMTHAGPWESSFDATLRKLLGFLPSDNVKWVAGALVAASPTIPALQRASSTAQSTADLDSRATESSAPMTSRERPIAQGGFDALRTECGRLGIGWEDNRRKGGALWVLLLDSSREPRMTALLDDLGFRFKPGKGFWLEGRN